MIQSMHTSTKSLQIQNVSHKNSQYVSYNKIPLHKVEKATLSTGYFSVLKTALQRIYIIKG